MTSLLAVHMQYVSLMILSIFGVGFPAVAMIRPVLEGDLGKATATAAASTGIVVYLALDWAAFLPAARCRGHRCVDGGIGHQEL